MTALRTMWAIAILVMAITSLGALYLGTVKHSHQLDEAETPWKKKTGMGRLWYVIATVQVISMLTATTLSLLLTAKDTNETYTKPSPCACSCDQCHR